MEYKVGEVYKVTKENGKVVERKCVAVVDKKFLAERDELKEKYGFAPMFVTPDGYVFLSLTPRSKLSEEEKARRLAEKRKKIEARIRALQEKMKKL